MISPDATKDSGSVSLVLGSYNRKNLLKLTIASIREELSHASFPHEIIVVDGGSTDGSLRWLSGQKDIITIIQHNRGTWKGKEIRRRSWGYFMNLGFRCAQGTYVCMLSDDCLVVPGAIINGFNLFENEKKTGKKTGAVAFYWRNWPDQKKYRVGLTLGNKMFVNHGMYLKKALEDVGYIDETTYLFYHADGDLCLKLWEKGYEITDSPDSYIEHYTHATLSVRKSNLKNQKQDWDNYLKKWKGIFYHPDSEDTGTWIEKEYTDSHNIAERRFNSIMLLRGNVIIRKLIKKYRENK